MNDQTTIPLKWLWAVMGFFFVTFAGGVAWLTTLYGTASSANERVMKIEQRLEISETEQLKLWHSVDKRLGRIEDKIGVKQ